MNQMKPYTSQNVMNSTSAEASNSPAPPSRPKTDSRATLRVSHASTLETFILKTGVEFQEQNENHRWTQINTDSLGQRGSPGWRSLRLSQPGSYLCASA